MAEREIEPGYTNIQPNVAALEALAEAEESADTARPATHAPVALLVVLCTGIFLAALDQTVVVTALRSIIFELGIAFTSIDQAAWIVNGYLLGYSVAMPLMGRISDVYGHRRTYMICLGIFTLGSVLCALASSLPLLVAARVIQATGGGAIVPVTMAIIADIFPPQRRGSVLGIIGAVVEAGGVLGPLWGVLIIGTIGGISFSLLGFTVVSWHWIFLINVPLGIAIILGTAALTRGERRTARTGSIDYPGAALIGAALTLLTIGLGEGSGTRDAWINLGLVAGALCLLAVFIWWERRATAPLLPPAIFAHRTFSAANLTNFLVGVALIIAMVDVPLFAAAILQYDDTGAGLLLLRLTVMIPVGALAGGFLTSRIHERFTIILGLLIAAAGFLLLARWDNTTGEWQATPGLLLTGFGFGVVIAPVATAVLNSVRRENAATASALVTVMRMVGMIIGLAALTAWALSRFNEAVSALGDIPLAPAPGESQTAFTARQAAYQAGVLAASLGIFHNIFMAAALVCLLAIIPALFITRHAP